MLKRFKLALYILLGKSIIVYEENTKAIVAMIGGAGGVVKKGLDVVIDRYVQENNDEIRYLGGKKEWKI